MTIRQYLAAIAGAAALLLLVLFGNAPEQQAAQQPAPPAAPVALPEAQKAPPAETKGPGGLPITGKSVEALAPLDEALEKIIIRHGIPGGAVAITREGKLVYAKGFGWSEYEANTLATPETLFGLASVSKVFTALAVLKLVEEGKLRLDQSAFDFFKDIQPPPGAAADPRLAKITIRHLLNHSGGWDRDKSGDPLNWSFRVSQALKVPMPINEDHLIRFMLGVKLDFDPGTQQVYSNFGYILLGQIVTRATGQPYDAYVRAKVMKPMGITRAQMHDREPRYFKDEARRYNPGILLSMPAYNVPWSDASGGWAASAVDLARLMTALDGGRGGKPFLTEALMAEMLAPPPPPLKPRADGTHFGLGWDAAGKTPAGVGYTKGGSWPGVRATVRHRPDGINTVILCNALTQMDQIDLRIANDAVREAQEAVSQIKEWPKIDLFDEYK